jgi:menaquinone-dependent protoporphyrinogen IX oxidase
LRIALIYYSRTGTTKEVSKYVEARLKEHKLNVDTYELRLVREYSRPLHLNLRLITDVLLSRSVSYVGDEGFNPEAYDLVVIGTPIWVGSITPPIRSFIRRYRGMIKAPIICFTTSLMGRDYSRKFKNELEGLGYKVIINYSLVDGISRSKETIELIVRGILKTLNIQQ